MPDQTSQTKQSSYKTITVDQLAIGMFVISAIDHKNNQITSEYFIECQQSIQQLKDAQIVSLTIDSTKSKLATSKDQNRSNFSVTRSEKKADHRNKDIVAFSDEIIKADQLYKNARALQQKLVALVELDIALSIELIRSNTDAMVDSIYRNQDALLCLSRIQAKDSYLLVHSVHVSILMIVFAKHLSVDKRLVRELAIGAFLHDIGKVRLANNLLNKTEQLTSNEQKTMQTHVLLGLKIIEDLPDISHIAMRMIKEHHERLNGSGYPCGLKGDEISKYGRMIAIVDSYDAMTCVRPYQDNVHPIAAFKHLLLKAPEYYDQRLVENFIQCLGIYPIGTLVKLQSGKLGLISQLNKDQPLSPSITVFYNTRLNQAIAVEKINLGSSKCKDQIDRCIKPEEFNINLIAFFKAAFID